MKSLLLLLGCLALTAHAADPEALLQQADRARGGGLPGLAWSIDIDSRDAEGTQHQTLDAIADTHNVRVDYTAPEKTRGQRVIMRGRNMWFSRPGLQRPVPISPRQRLIGQAANGDIATTNYLADYEAREAGQERVDEEDCVVFELSARERSVTYDRIRYWVSQARGLGLKAEFYTVSGKLLKTARFRYDNEISFEGRKIPFVSRMSITDAIRPDSVTTLSYRQVRISKPDPARFDPNA